jgi:hypothetical protein
LETRGSARTVNRGSLPCIANRKNGDTVEWRDNDLERSDFRRSWGISLQK